MMWYNTGPRPDRREGRSGAERSDALASEAKPEDRRASNASTCNAGCQ